MARSRTVIDVADEVRLALREARPVVALESTLIAHGLPFPDNLETALQLEAAVRAEGTVPATIAVLEGVPRIGLDRPALERLARPERRVQKVGSADLAVLAALRLDG